MMSLTTRAAHATLEMERNRLCVQNVLLFPKIILSNVILNEPFDVLRINCVSEESLELRVVLASEIVRQSLSCACRRVPLRLSMTT